MKNSIMKSLNKLWNKQSGDYALRPDDLHDEILQCFREGMAFHSVKKKCLYPTSFNILLNPDDYKLIEQTLPYIAEQSINSFYEILQATKKKSQYNDFIPPSKNWFFQFSPCEKISLTDNAADTIIVERNTPYIIGSLYTNQIGGDSSSPQMVNVSVKPNNSTGYKNTDINVEAFRGIDVKGKDIFTKKIDYQSFAPLMEAPVNVYAEIEYNGGEIFSMVDAEIIISQRNAADNGKSYVLQLQSPNIITNHARIRYLPDGKNFEIAAFEFARVNEIVVPLSSGGNMQWMRLSPKSNILLGGNSNSLPVSLKFSSKK